MPPVATPPNTVVFADPEAARSDVLRADAPRDLVALFKTVGATSVFGFDSPLVNNTTGERKIDQTYEVK